MKKFVSLFITMVFFLSVSAQAAGDDPFYDPFNLSYARDRMHFPIEVDREEGVAYITTDASIDVREFRHKYESSQYYSFTQWEALVQDYFEATPYPIYRLWIKYVGTKHIYATSIAFTFGGKEYVFNGVLGKDNIYELENEDAVEELLIVSGNDNADFIFDLMDHLAKIREVENWIDKEIPEELKITMELRGTEIVTSELGRGFVLDFWGMELVILHSGGASKWLENTETTPMIVNTLQ